MKLREKVYLVDKNVILRYLLDDHKTYSRKAKAFMLQVSQGKKKVEIPAMVITECIYVLEKFYEVHKKRLLNT